MRTEFYVGFERNAAGEHYDTDATLLAIEAYLSQKTTWWNHRTEIGHSAEWGTEVTLVITCDLPAREVAMVARKLAAICQQSAIGGFHGTASFLYRDPA